MHTQKEGNVTDASAKRHERERGVKKVWHFVRVLFALTGNNMLEIISTASCV